MRKDMFKVIVERPRTGRGWAKVAKPGRTRALTDDDGDVLPAREPEKREQRTKGLNENLSPLKRYLESQVGRPWNKVYAEISANLSASSTVQQHVRDHIQDFVAVKSRMEGGKVRVSRARFGDADIALEEDWRPFFVHPRSGLLKRNPGRLKERQARNKARRAHNEAVEASRKRVGAKTWLFLVNERWYEAKLAPREEGMPNRDVFLGEESTPWQRERFYGRDGVRAVSARLLTKADLKKHGLN